MSLNAFGPRSLNFNIAATQTPSTAIQISADPLCDVYQFINTGTAIAYIAVGNSKDIQAAIAAPNVPANGTPILPNEIVLYRFGPNSWISAICDTGKTTNLFITVGEGM